MKPKYLIALILINIFFIQSLLSQSYTYNIKIAAHIVRNAQGQYGIDTNDVTTSVNQVNTVYIAHNNSDIYFELAYYDYIDNDNYTTGEKIDFQPTGYTFQQKLQNLFNEKNNVGVIHVYFIKKEFTTGFNAGVSQNIPGYKIVVTNEDAINGETLAHEMGHCLGLLHTYEATRYTIWPDNDHSWADGEGLPNQPEWVARQGYTCSNSTNNGDLLNDTPADPIYDEGEIAKFIRDCNFHNDNNIRDNSSCRNLYAGVLINNIMALPVGCSRWQFTTDQISRMKAFLDDRLKSINNTIPVVIANKLNGTIIPNTLEKPSTVAIDAYNYNSGSTTYLNEVNHIGKTNQERFVNYQSTNIKHHDWNNTSSEFHLSENFTPAVVSPFRDANFLNMNYSKIESRLEGQQIQDKGTFEFNDPWYIKSDLTQPGNYWIPCLSSYEPNGKHGATEKGVFLNQEIAPNKPYYSVAAISPQPITINGRTHTFYFQNWSGTNVEYEHADQLETGVVFTNENAVASANLKGTQLSNEQNAYANNSQRKLVRTDDGWLHCVYESMGRVWYETSTDNGITWNLMNDGKPLDNGEAKLPSLDYSSFYDPQIEENIYQIAIVFQENNSNRIRLQYFHRVEDEIDYTKFDEEVVQNLGGNYASHNANPVIGFDHGNNITIVWQHTSSGLFGRYGVINYISGITLYGTGGNHLTGTTMSSVTPTIYVSKSGTATTHLSWAQIVSEEQTDIKYAKMSGSNIIGNIVTASQGSGFSKNYNPSIIEINGGARICWIGFRDISRDEYKTVFKDPDYWRFWNFDDGVKSVNINKAPNYYAITWGRGNSYPVRYTINSKLSNPQSLSIYGKDVQVCNGSSPTDVRAMAFNSNALPYYFTNSNIPLYKENDLAVGSGREGVVAKDSAQFYFAVGDIKVDGQPINFIEFDDTVSFYSVQRLNELLVSEHFVLNDNSDFIYSVQYGITDSASAVSVLGNNDYINFKVELRDEQNGELMGLFDNITYTASNAVQYENIAYQVSTQGISNKTVRLRLVVENNINPCYAITDRYAEENALLKSTTKQISYQGSLAVKEYALEQNYPNPFNPSTVISWQSPISSHQSLKVYDVLGREVATLVNEWRESGRYSTVFDGSKLASGVYIYQLRINDYEDTKKLLLLK